MRGALGDAAQRLAEVGRAAHERHGEGPLVDVVRLVGRGEDLALVDVVDAERLEHLRLGEVPDAGLRHHRDRDGRLDRLDQRRVAHPGDAAVAADVGGHPLERHHRHGTGVLGDLRLLGGDDVHDHATAQHLGEPALDAKRPRRTAVRLAGAGAFARHDLKSTASPSTCSHRRPGRSWRDPDRRRGGAVVGLKRPRAQERGRARRRRASPGGRGRAPPGRRHLPPPLRP